ncbi:MAG TPA: ribonuclease P protein component [Firmicutes bacterium]|nr:ribonuclease P protein component [Candidatus Fermentithermobacillaceae bacterium]
MAKGRIPAPHYRRVFKEGRSTANRYLVLYYLPDDTVKMGVSVSARLGKATKRNKVRRRVREAFRLMGPSATGGGQFVFIVRKKALEATYKEIEEAVRDLVKRMTAQNGA